MPGLLSADELVLCSESEENLKVMVGHLSRNVGEVNAEQGDSVG